MSEKEQKIAIYVVLVIVAYLVYKRYFAKKMIIVRPVGGQPMQQQQQPPLTVTAPPVGNGPQNTQGSGGGNSDVQWAQFGVQAGTTLINTIASLAGGRSGNGGAVAGVDGGYPTGGFDGSGVSDADYQYNSDPPPDGEGGGDFYDSSDYGYV